MKCLNFAKGAAAGMVIGAAAVMLIDPISEKQRNRIKRKTKGVFRSIGNVVDTAFDIIR